MERTKIEPHHAVSPMGDSQRQLFKMHKEEMEALDKAFKGWQVAQADVSPPDIVEEPCVQLKDAVIQCYRNPPSGEVTDCASLISQYCQCADHHQRRWAMLSIRRARDELARREEAKQQAAANPQP
eukprot:Hpha_TRINITY_DN524_c0_g1::TRINITY_DN524_c0_g1_i1::g.171634::m.171634